LRIRRQVTHIEKTDDKKLKLTLNYWEPRSYLEATQQNSGSSSVQLLLMGVFFAMAAKLMSTHPFFSNGLIDDPYMLWTPQKTMQLILLGVVLPIVIWLSPHFDKKPPSDDMVGNANSVLQDVKGGTGAGKAVDVNDMLVGGSGSPDNVQGITVATEIVTARHVINCAGGASDQIAAMVGDTSFKIKPRLGDYLLLNRNQGYLASHTLFPCPDPVLGKGVLVQTTLWGNLILGPTARDMYKTEARDMSPASIQEYILSKCKRLVPSFDAKETFHAFAGARAKSDKGDWIIEVCKTCPQMVHVASIDSPGLAGSVRCWKLGQHLGDCCYLPCNLLMVTYV